MATESVHPNEMLDDGLPPPGVARWSPGRKEAVVLAVRRRRLTVAEACRRYELSEAELIEWLHRYARHGLRGLAVTSFDGLRR
jgi:transposase-like protein